MINKPLVKKENLERLLKLLSHLLKFKGNEWFKVEVKKILRESEVSLEEKRDTLHSYSEGGDHYLIINPNAWLIDYNDIPNEKIRTQLKIDCFEMARHRLGRVNHIHTPDFNEFCRYAQLQIEELLNYYYYEQFKSNLTAISKDIINYNAKATGKIENARELGQIGIIYKVWAFNNKFGLGRNSINIMLQLCYLRNNLSHRSSLANKNDEQILEDFEKKNGLIKDLSFNDLMKSDTTMQNLLFKKRQCWDEVVCVITKLKTTVVQQL